MAEQKTKTKSSLKNFAKGLFGDKFKGLSEEDTNKILAELGSLQQDLLNEVNNLAQTDSDAAEKLADQIAKTSGLTFESFETGNGGKGFVLVDTTGKRRGGAFPTRDNANEGRIDDKTSVQGDAFISKNDVIKTIKSLDKLANNDNLTERLTNVIHQKSQSLQDIVAVKSEKHEVKLSKALTTTTVAFVVGALIAGGLIANRTQKSTDVKPEIEIVYVDREVEKEETLAEKVDDLKEDTEDLIDEYGDTSQLIKAYNQEEWQENELAGVSTESEQERHDSENVLQERMEKHDEFLERLEKIEEGRADGSLSDRDYALEVLKLSRDVHRATSDLKGEEIIALDGVIESLNAHYNNYYVPNGIADDTHADQIRRYENDKESAQGTIKDSDLKADQYDYVIAQMDANPDMTMEDAATLLQETVKKGVPQANQENAVGNDVAEEGAVQ